MIRKKIKKCSFYKISNTAAILAILITFTGSCTTKRQTIVINPHAGEYQVNTIAVLPFSIQNEKGFSGQYPEAAKTAYESLETHLLSLSFQIADRENLDKIMKEIQMSGTGLTESEGKRIGKLLNVDAVVFGHITSYIQGSRLHESSGKLEETRFGFSLKALHVESGIVLAKVSMYRKKGGIFSYTSPIQALIDQMMEDLARNLKKKGM